MKIGDPTINFLTFKYSEKFESTRGFFAGNEIPKIESFLASVMAKDSALPNEVNPALAAKIEEIWDLMAKGMPRLKLHIVTNLTEGFEPSEQTRLSRFLRKYDVELHIHTQKVISDYLVKKDRKPINGKIRAIGENRFETGKGDLRALVLELEAFHLLRLLSDSEHLRQTPTLQNVADLTKSKIEERAFEDNVRVYLRQRSGVNEQIKQTALSPDRDRFFYFNNGITVTCDSFSYRDNETSPVVDLKNIQVVNGGQTIHALRETLEKDTESLKPIRLLCRIYQTTDPELSSKIAQFTNSQSPVRSRDVMSNRPIQLTLEREFYAQGFFYERKRRQYEEKPKSQRIDAERCGQVALAFYQGMPLEAKNRKGLIFGEKFDEIFFGDFERQAFSRPITAIPKN